MSLLENHFTGRRTAVLDLIRQLVERESGSRTEANLNEIAHFAADLLAAIGGEVNLTAVPGYGTHLRAHFGFDHSPNSPRVLIIGHLDTVWPLGTLERRPFHIAPEGQAYGPGIFDMKSGIAIAIETLCAIRTLNLRTKRPLTLLLTCDEEIGSKTSRGLVEEEAGRAAAALILEPPLTGGIVKTGRKGIGTFSLRAIGRAAHAGLDPTKGINAIVELSHQTIKLASLNDPARGITLSVGLFQGGTAINVVPPEATAKVDVRFWASEDGEMIARTIRSLTPVLSEARIEISGGINRPPMPRSEKNIALFEHARDLASELGFDLKDQVVGGGSDGNFTAAMGVPTLDGLGVDGAGAHAEHEHIFIDDIPRRAALLTRLVQTI